MRCSCLGGEDVPDPVLTDNTELEWKYDKRDPEYRDEDERE